MRLRPGSWLTLAVASALLSCNGCKRAPGPQQSPASSAAATKSVAAKVPPSASLAPPVPPTRRAIPDGGEPRGCRAISLSGDVHRLDGAALRASELFDGKSWLELRAGASVTFKHASSTREWTLLGPGRMRPCRAGGEQVAVASGRLRTTAGAGARPGAEVLVFTPHGALRYGDAALTLSVDKRKLTVVPQSGDVWLVPLDPQAPAPTVALAAGKPKVVDGKLTALQLEQRCDSLSQRAAELGSGFTAAISPSARADLSTRAVEHLKARRAARVVCGVGESLAASLEGSERGRLLDRFTVLDLASRSLHHDP